MSRIHEALKAAQRHHEQMSHLSSDKRDEAAEVTSAPYGPLAEKIDVSNTAGAAPRVSWPIVSSSSLKANCEASKWNPDPLYSLFVGGGTDRVAAESFRTLRSRLMQIRAANERIKTVLVASSMPAEGKTFVCCNLAQALATQPGTSVLLVDCDLRRPKLHSSLGIECRPGLADYLALRVDERAIVRRCPLSELYFIPAGSTVENPAELIGSDRFANLLQRVRSEFDWVLVDSPPCVPVSDASRIASACDGIILVVRASQTSAEEVQRGCALLGVSPILGVALNHVAQSRSYLTYYDEPR